jgi:hypothetical protein
MLRVLSDSDLVKLRSQLDSGDFEEVLVVWSHGDWGDPYYLTLPMLQKRFPIEQEWDLHDVTVYRLHKDRASRMP